jgi:hypothetical protein
MVGNGTNGLTYALISYTAPGGSFANGACYMHKTYTVGGGVSGDEQFPFSLGTLVPATCPANSSASGSACNCNAGFQPDGAAGTSCVPECVAGQVTSSGWYDIGTAVAVAPVGLYCVGQCAVVSTGATNVETVVVGGVKRWFAQMGFTTTGGRCDGSSTPPPAPTSPSSEPPQNTCGANQYAGTVNGVFRCIDKSTGETVADAPATPSPMPVVNTPGQQTTQGTTTVTNNGDGTTTTTTVGTTVTTKPDGTVTTGTTTTTKTCDAAGNCVTSTKTGGYGSGTSGSESGSGTCEEDDPTIGCAPGGDPPSPEVIPRDEKTMSITPQSGWSHDSSCPQDKVLSLHFVTVTVPFTLLCTAGDMARPIVVLVAWVVAAFAFLGLSKRD